MTLMREIEVVMYKEKIKYDMSTQSVSSRTSPLTMIDTLLRDRKGMGFHVRFSSTHNKKRRVLEGGLANANNIARLPIAQSHV